MWNDWQGGYVSDIGYTYGYHAEMSVSMLRLAALYRGIEIASKPEDDYNYLEIGFGQGVSINIHAAAGTGQYWGNDFNPGHALHAQQLAAVSNAGATLLDDAIAELAARPDLPEMDFITLHGVWSWVSAENRAAIVDLLRRKLRVGGAVYISYNCLPGHAQLMPLRHLLSLHTQIMGGRAGGTVSKIDDAVQFAQKLAAADAQYFKVNPLALSRLKHLSGRNHNYLAHEYFNRDWEPMPFSQVADQLNDAKLSFVAPARLLDHMDDINLSSEGQDLINGIADPVMSETTRDYLLNTQFRCDIFTKGARPLTQHERLERLKEMSFVLLALPEDIPMRVMGALTETQLDKTVYFPVIDVLSENHYQPKSLAFLTTHPKTAHLPITKLAELVVTLTGTGHAHPAQSTAIIAKVSKRCHALNTHLCKQAVDNGDIQYLASPVTGGAVKIGRIQQMFLQSCMEGSDQPDAWVKVAWANFKAQGQKLTRNGTTLNTNEENLEVLIEEAQALQKRLGLLQALGVIPPSQIDTHRNKI